VRAGDAEIDRKVGAIGTTVGRVTAPADDRVLEGAAT
jgi:hypothetical protein